ncbi:MAG: hypothetical protein LQ345_005116 [Seirophora villosa]|nr:MAG: hypothetical protein LQ345_005116 [Seirophora villosa]
MYLHHSLLLPLLSFFSALLPFLTHAAPAALYKISSPNLALSKLISPAISAPLLRRATQANGATILRGATPPSIITRPPANGLTSPPIIIRVPLPPPNERRYITVIIRLQAEPLAISQIEYCLVALDDLCERMINNPSTRGPGADIIPAEAYPLKVAPRQAMGAYVQIDQMHPPRPLRWPVLLLAARGLFEGMLAPPPFPRGADFEIWCVLWLFLAFQTSFPGCLF